MRAPLPTCPPGYSDVDLITDKLDAGGWEPEDIAKYYGYDLATVHAACGEKWGHSFETYTDGDESTPFFRIYRACAICGAPDEREGEPGDS